MDKPLSKQPHRTGKHATIALSTLNQWSLDFEGNLERILESIVQAKEQGATFRTGPELEICGLNCEDHFYESDTFSHSWEVLVELMLAPCSKDMLIDVGMPVMHKDSSYNCRIVFLNKQILLLRPKIYVCDDGHYGESRWFAAWRKIRQIEDFCLPRIVQEATGQLTAPIGDGVLSLRDTCLGFEICEELWNSSSNHIPMGLDGVEIICNASGSHTQLGKAFVVRDLVNSTTFKSGGCYTWCNLRGCDGERMYFGGNSLISVNGQIVAMSNNFKLREVEVTSATIDLDDIRVYKNRARSRSILAGGAPIYPRIFVDYHLCPEYDSVVPITIPTLNDYWRIEEQVARGPACWLWDYLRRTGQGGYFLPLSGGLDSASAAVIVYSMCRLVVEAVQEGEAKVLSDVRKITGDCTYVPKDPKELCNRLLITCYMATENSSTETKQRAADLAAAIGCYHMAMDIDAVVKGALDIFRTITGMSPKFGSSGGSTRENLALQNLQARLRMVMSYLFAQLMLWVRGKQGGLLVLGSLNSDEALRGYFTKYDCSSADLNPIGSLSKIELRKFLDYMREHYDLPILGAILSALPTAELVPLKNGRIVQTDEEEMGMTYLEINLFSKLRKNCGPYSMFCKLVETWSTQCTPKEVADKVKNFFRYYAINRHKMTVVTPAYHAEGYNADDNRYDLRPFLYRTDWSWQFKAIDKQLEYQSKFSKRGK